MVFLLYGFPDVVFFIPGLLCSNVFCFWSSYCTHGHKLGVAAGGYPSGKILLVFAAFAGPFLHVDGSCVVVLFLWATMVSKVLS